MVYFDISDRLWSAWPVAARRMTFAGREGWVPREPEPRLSGEDCFGRSARSDWVKKTEDFCFAPSEYTEKALRGLSPAFAGTFEEARFALMDATNGLKGRL